MSTDELNGLFSMPDDEHKELPLSEDLSWLKEKLGKFVAGGIYLLAGQPGIGKSTLGSQIGLDVCKVGFQPLFILTEQSKGDLAGAMRRLTRDWTETLRQQTIDRVKVEIGIEGLHKLPKFFSDEVLQKEGKYHGVKLIVLDSVQGHGLSSAATREYKQLYEFCRMAKRARITVILIAHVNKNGQIAGPKDLEHNADVVMHIQRKFPLRPLFITKNRYGPSTRIRGIQLEMDEDTGRLRVSLFSDSITSVARTYLGKDKGITEAQVCISLPPYGTKGQIVTQGLPRGDIKQVLVQVSQMLNEDNDESGFNIVCRIPDGKKFGSMGGLATCTAIYASFRQKVIPENCVFIGEVDLLKKVRGVPEHILAALIDDIKSAVIKTPLTIYCPSEIAARFSIDMDGLTIVVCEHLEDAVYHLWPELKK